MSFAEIAALTLHDVKNRLAKLAGRAEARGDVDTLRETIEASNTLTRLLTYYRSDVGSLTLDIDAHAPADLAAEFVEDAIVQGGCPVDLDCSQAPTLWFYDEAVVRMVLANAVHNAGRHARARIVIEVAERGGFLEFLVRDDGNGYRQEVLEDVTGAATPVTRNGTGLGLRLARRIAEMHENAGQQGEIRLENAGGAVFRLLLPK
ncbi:MAG: ATP-binding protein [Candidatus Accumulibacter phosphatis]|jgi:signal transduction histidine kinase|uniref:histidine kinase n=2 Tax=Candidatus Accumulibacter TaxID=327159 RepID=A0A084Y6J9_9PROT|nr:MULTISPECIES: ATP-binding protein [Candidatus Accumulibacter]KFB70343.1 MAG: sensor protein RstB [Candidatus Accumulibacter phosphatis]MBL8409569.1 ATP-binding protein [Accumulibacter sp.]NMQ07038.1 ATP-binding protein [Candidatus Accumulibacter contiguus]HCZ13135.1 ATP-binding protein [Accumulibacter sp.]HRF12083.1 ATP-binding protein [Candidatus Accumulibacter phosphatis]